MSNDYFKDEKKDEKDEKEIDKREEKTIDEKWRRDPLGTMAWAIVLIWAGVALLIVNNTNLLDNLPFLDKIGRESGTSPAWSIILVGAGFIFLLEVLVRLIMPAYRRPIFGSLIFAIILIGIGLGNLFNWWVAWSLVLIFLGLSMILRRK
jgi:hypothetical protein